MYKKGRKTFASKEHEMNLILGKWKWKGTNGFNREKMPNITMPDEIKKKTISEQKI